MRPTLDLLDLPYTFWQLRPLTEDQFRKEAKARGVFLQERELEGLHRLRLLTPLLRVSRNGREIASAARRDDPLVWQLAHWQLTYRLDLLAAREDGRLFDPTQEHFIARRRLRREVGDVSYRSSEYLYSHHQLLALPLVRGALPYLRYGSGGEINGLREVERWVHGHWRERAGWLHSRLMALSVLEPIYYPHVIRRIHYNGEELAEFDTWLGRLRPLAMLDWLGVEPAWIKDSAGVLLDEAEQIDPLGRWSELVREADPRRWEWLEGEARSALDLRIGAEVLLRYYDRLVQGRIAPKIKPPQGRWRGQFSARLKPRGSLDRVLTDFGLSPHPRLVLVVEGETELFVFPFVMGVLGIRTERDFIAIENAKGVGRDISALIAYAVAPQTEQDDSGRYLRPLKPLTRLLTVMDAEGRYSTAGRREERRQIWINRILETLPAEHRTAAVRDSVERLVTVETWDRGGQSFEFAHFTDRELARASAKVDKRDPPSIAQRIEVAGSIRASRGNLAPLLSGASKVELAKALMPVLQRKLERSQKHGTEERIPIVRVLDRAIELAHEMPRRNVVIPLKKMG